MKKENHPKLQRKEVSPNLLVITVGRKDIHLMFVGERMQMRMKNQNPWHTIKSARNKDIKHMNVGPESQRYLSLKDTATTIISMDIENKNAYLNLSGQTNGPKKGNFCNWDYNTWYNCHHCGEYGHVAQNCIRRHLR